MKKIDVVILQRVCPIYRKNVFENFQKIYENSLLIIGEDIPHSKVKNSRDLNSINHIKLKTKNMALFGRSLTIHVGLLKTLIKINPKIIVCEAESHIIGYLTAILYKYFFSRKTKLAYWCFIQIPGRYYNPKSIKELYKKIIRKHFNHFFVYHTYGKKKLIQSGVLDENITTILNVGQVEKFKKLKSHKINKIKAKKNLNLSNEITLLYIGAMDSNKNPQILFEIKNELPFNTNLIFLGDGSNFLEIQKKSINDSSILAPGHISDNDDLINYLSASDILVVPSRGGVIISELLAFGIPIIVHQADGIEFDLIQNGKNGYIIENNEVKTFVKYISLLKENLNKNSFDEFKYDSSTMASSLKKGIIKTLKQ